MYLSRKAWVLSLVIHLTGIESTPIVVNLPKTYLRFLYDFNQKKRFVGGSMTNLKKEKKIYNCLRCGKPMEQVLDSIQKKYTGYLWRCNRGCMTKNMVMSIG